MERLSITIVGLGLIGGSIGKALRLKTKHRLFGTDKDFTVTEKALEEGVIDEIAETDNFSSADVSFICLPPIATVEFIRQNISRFKKGSIITDVCGVKSYIYNSINEILQQNGLFYVGGHPMAGKERSGYENSDALLLENASYILTENEQTSLPALNLIEELIRQIGCTPVITDTTKHDGIIAYTSQLAHIVSSSYIKSPTAKQENGFTGGSFQDMTRVAFLDENMWTELFLLNRENLLKEIETITVHIDEYKKAIEQADGKKLASLLKEGKDLKAKHLK